MPKRNPKDNTDSNVVKKQQRKIDAFFTAGKLFLVRPKIELEIEIILSEVGTKTKILHFIVLELPTDAQEISTASAMAGKTTTATATTTTTTMSTSSSSTSIEPRTSGISVSVTTNVNINSNDDVADEGTFWIYSRDLRGTTINILFLALFCIQIRMRLESNISTLHLKTLHRSGRTLIPMLRSKN